MTEYEKWNALIAKYEGNPAAQAELTEARDKAFREWDELMRWKNSGPRIRLPAGMLEAGYRVLIGYVALVLATAVATVLLAWAVTP